MLIRDARASDFSAIAELTNIYIRTTPVHFAYEPVTAAELEALWVKTRERYPWLVGEVNDAFVGYAKAGAWRERAAYGWTPEVGIYMMPAGQGLGLGKKLYGALLDELRKRGFHSAIGGLTLPNEASEALHRALGFQLVGTVRQAGWKTGAWHDVAFYQVMLQGSEHTPG